MDGFVRSLSSFASACRQDLSGFRAQEQSLNMNFKALKLTIKRLEQGPGRSRAANPPHPLAKSHPRSIPDKQKLPPLEAVSRRRLDLQPVPFLVRSYAMRAQPCRAAARLYRPKARERIEEERLDLIDEYVNFHSPETAVMLDGQIDPALRVGPFHPNELKWNGQIPLSVY
jgi:hypothetical protein